jgi:hypothetical protein
MANRYKGASTRRPAWPCVQGEPPRATVPLVGERRSLIEEVTWEAYEALLKGWRSRSKRMTYDRGSLEFMSPLLSHEQYGALLGRLVVFFALERKIPLHTGRMLTIKRIVDPENWTANQATTADQERGAHGRQAKAAHGGVQGAGGFGGVQGREDGGGTGEPTRRSPDLDPHLEEAVPGGAEEIFGSPAKADGKDAEALQSQLFEQIGRRQIELDRVKKR